jgi:predicted nucleotidyltransferase
MTQTHLRPIEEIIVQIQREVANYSHIHKAWLFGSFARNRQHENSDLNIVIDTDEHFNYFDLAELQHKLQHEFSLPVDIGFWDTMVEEIKVAIHPDLILIYEKGQ